MSRANADTHSTLCFRSQRQAAPAWGAPARRPFGRQLIWRRTKQTRPRLSGHRCPQKEPSPVNACSRRLASIMALVIGSVAIAIAGDDWERDWTVVTMARNGSWGVGIDHPIAGA